MNDKLHEIEKLLCDARDLIADLDPDVVDELGLTKTLSNVNANTNVSLVLLSICRYRTDDAGMVH